MLSSKTLYPLLSTGSTGQEDRPDMTEKLLTAWVVMNQNTQEPSIGATWRSKIAKTQDGCQDRHIEITTSFPKLHWGPQGFWRSWENVFFFQGAREQAHYFGDIGSLAKKQKKKKKKKK